MRPIFPHEKLAKFLGPTPEGRPRVAHRVLAKAVDLFVMVLISVLLIFPIGPLFGFFYSLVADGLEMGPFRRQSVGKKLLGLEVVNSKTHARISYRDSAIRNAPIGVATFFGLIPVWGWLIVFLLGLPLVAFEIYLLTRTQGQGYRWGDVMAETEVRLAPEGPIAPLKMESSGS